MKRVAYVDEISGLLIVYMILLHIFQFCGMSDMLNSCLMQILSFFMFWFFYKSGMFYREKTCKDILLGGGKKLLIPFVVFGLLGHLLDCVKYAVADKLCFENVLLLPIKCLLNLGTIGGNLPLWFLSSLLAVQLLYAFLHRHIRDEWICLLGFAVAFLTYWQGWHRPVFVGNIALGLLAYSMGHRLRDNQYERSILLLSLATFIVTFIIQPSFIDVRANELTSGYYPLAVLFGLSGCVFINNLFKKFPFNIRLLEYIGIRSMKYYVMHWLVLCVCITLPFSGWSLWGVMVGACIIALPLADKTISALRMEWVFGISPNKQK